MEALYDSPPLSISYDPTHKWLFVEWRGHHTTASALSGGEQVISCLRQKSCHKMLNDNSLVTNDWEPAARWVGAEFYPRLAELQMRYVAWVCANNWSARRSMEATMLFITEPTVVLFDDVATAYTWLMRQGGTTD